ncbi:hypothetical protein P280DRAFT_254000 [Massarina eburnea CBS 473.64]|uniref:Integral membrane protein-like protein n=1 Tax=Massarina eburnea CBS 473.64 TaxID=1395130 RepID=A0A6A6SAN7_9PLEO|nr:hypothetical protein P280DRAFT_254000 [Massarina eburnea CBS 473.64]
MGKLGRFAAIFIPMGLTIASLVCLCIVLVGQTSVNGSLSTDLWFFKADTHEFKDNPDFTSGLANLPGADKIDSDLLNALRGAATTKDLQDFYKIGFWGYCKGDLKDGKEVVTFCSDRQNYFWFNPVEVWDLGNTTTQKLFPDDMQKGLDTYKKVARWMVIAYEIAVALTAAEIVIGISALFSRLGSLVTTFVSIASTIFTFAAAITVTALYASLVAVFESVLKPYDIKSSMGRQMLSTLWLGVAFSLASGFFWLFSVCCCSGKSSHKKTVVEKTPYTYERVASPYMGGSGNGHQMQDMHSAGGHGPTGGAFEPYRSRV